MTGSTSFAAIALLLPTPQTARSADLDVATQANLAGDYSRAVSLFRPLAVAGDPLAQYSLANMYAAGQGVKEDQTAAVRWLQRAVDGGYRQAAVDLGNRAMSVAWV